MPKALKESIEPERLDNRWDIMEIEDNISHAEDVGTGASMEREFMEDNTFTDLPNALIVTNVAECVFDDEDAKVRYSIFAGSSFNIDYSHSYTYKVWHQIHSRITCE